MTHQLFSANWDYSLVTDRRSLFQNLTGGDWVQITPLVPFSEYYVQVNASNTKGFILSNTKLAEMPAGCKCESALITYGKDGIVFDMDRV